MRTKIAYCFFMIIGIALICLQVYKYATNQLGFYMLELIVLVVGVCFILYPRKIITIFENKFINK